MRAEHEVHPNPAGGQQGHCAISFLVHCTTQLRESCRPDEFSVLCAGRIGKAGALQTLSSKGYFFLFSLALLML